MTVLTSGSGPLDECSGGVKTEGPRVYGHTPAPEDGAGTGFNRRGHDVDERLRAARTPGGILSKQPFSL